MRRLLALALLPLLALSLALTACGGAAAPPTPKPKPTIKAPGVTDPTSHVSTTILRARAHRGYILLYISMHNAGRTVFAPANAAQQFIDEALVEPNSQGTVGVCSADNSAGPGLQYGSVRARATNKGWLRCDYPNSTHVIAIFWLNHDLGNFRVS
jgi:hypothetical protein